MFKDNLKDFIDQNKWLLIILLTSFGLSIFYSFYYQIKPRVDARAYDDIAVNIAAGNGYRELATNDFQYDFSLNRVGPLYEYFLAGIYKIFGHNYAPVWILQALLHVFSALLIYLSVLLIFSAEGGSASGGKENEARDRKSVV